MAYMSQAAKAAIAAELKAIVPRSWKWSLAVKDSSTIVFTVSSAPGADLGRYRGEHAQVNVWHPESFFPATTLPLAKAIIKALNANNYNDSDSQHDYFDVGHYVSFNIGRWDKHFVATD